MTDTSHRGLLQQAYRAITDLQERLARHEGARHEPIAIIGVGCRFPGGADDPDALWRLLRDGVDATSEVPADRYDADAYYAADPGVPGKANTRRGGFIRAVDRFDPQFFGLSPREAALMDPQQRLLLEVAWEALESAAIAPERLAGSQTGVFVGVYNNDYAWSDPTGSTIADPYAATGAALSVVPGRLSFFLDLRGPSIAVDTACSSSLVALHLACQSLRADECEVALAGGVSLILGPRATLLLAKMGVLAPDGRCKPFDASADGFARGEGAGVVVLKRMSRALADGDRILGIIRASALNQDGRSVGLTAPNPRAQAALIRQALAACGLRPEHLSYIEAHGTGTPLGDPIEIEGLGELFGAPSPDHRCWIGSIKANLGHLEACAGIAGLIKTVLALQHRAIPPHLHFTRLNPRISLSGTPLAIPTELTPWTSPGPRRAGVSAFGISGTNAHVVLEEAPPQPHRDPPRVRSILLPLSARTPTALHDQARAFRDFLAADTPDPLRLDDLALTAATGRAHFAHRVALVADHRDALLARLDAFLADQPSPGLVAGRAGDSRPRVAFVFPGQGSQWAGMGRRLLADQPVFRAVVDRCDAALRPHIGASVRAHLEGTSDAWLADIDQVQSTLFTVQCGLAALWESWGIEPDVVVGHSMGEVAAAHVAGALSLDDAARVIGRRSRILLRARGQGAMASIELPVERVHQALLDHGDRLSVAAINGPTSTVVAGDASALAALIAELQRHNVFCRLVKVDVASHSAQMDPLRAELLAALAGITPRSAKRRMCSTVHERPIDGRELDADYWARNLRDPVRFWPAVERLLADGVRVFLEISPHMILGDAVLRAIEHAGRDALCLPSLRRDEDPHATLLASLGALHVHGHPIQFAPLYPDARRVALPTYPFQRIRCWHAPTPASRPATSIGHPLLGARLPTALPTFEVELAASTHPLLDGHRLHGTALVPLAVYLAMALAAAAQVLGDADELLDIVVERPFVADAPVAVQITCLPDATGEALVQIFGAPAAPPRAWQRYFTARARRATDIPDPPDPAALADSRRRCAAPVDLAGHFARLRSRGLELTPRGLEHIHRGHDEALARVALPPSDPALLDPALLDAALQVVGAAMSGDDLALVTGLRRFRLHRPPGPELVSHARVTATDPSGALLDLRLLAEDGATIATLSDLRLRRPAPAFLRQAADERAASWHYLLRWEPRPAPAADTSARRWYIVAAPDDLGAALAARLTACGQTAIQLSADQLAAAPLAGADVVYLGALDAGSRATEDDPDDLATWEQALRDACSGALRVAQLLTRRGGCRLRLVTRGAQPVGAAAPDPIQAALWGLGRGLALEHPEIWRGLVDLDAGDAEASAHSLTTQLLAHDHEDQIAIRGDVRHVARLTPTTAPPPGEPSSADDGVHLITGGLGGLGLLLARWLVERGVRHLVLVGRGGPTAAASATLDALRVAGATVTLAAIDICDPVALAATLAEIDATGRPLRGVYHAAATFSAHPIEQLDDAALAAALHAKAAGAWNLHRLTRAHPLARFVLFASTAGIWGASGLAHYAAANHVLDALAHRRRALGLPALSIDWGVWSAGQASTDSVQRWAAQSGLHAMPPELALSALGRALADPAPQRIIAWIDWSVLAPLLAARGPRPFLEHVLAPPAVRDAPGRAALAEALRDLPPEARRSLLQAHIVREVTALLHLPADALDPTQGFFQCGMDSRTSVELRNRLQTALGCPLPTTLAFDHPTPVALAAHLLTRMHPVAPTTAVQDPPRPAAATGTTQRDAIDALPDDEAEAALEERLLRLEKNLEIRP